MAPRGGPAALIAPRRHPSARAFVAGGVGLILNKISSRWPISFSDWALCRAVTGLVDASKANIDLDFLSVTRNRRHFFLTNFCIVFIRCSSLFIP